MKYETGDITPLKSWFHAYCRKFHSPDPELNRNLILKEVHTEKVCAAMVRIASEEGVTGRELFLAETMALFHDIGRFRQFSEYGTFKDGDSLNHAVLGGKVLREEGVLATFPGHEQELVLKSVQLHNVFAVPDSLSGVQKTFLQMLRDADKIDIWRVFIEYYTLPGEERASGVALGFPDTPGCSAQALNALRNGSMVQLSMIRNLNDFKLLQLSWLYDLNFAASFRMLTEHRLIDRLAATLPKDVIADVPMEQLKIHIANNVS